MKELLNGTISSPLGFKSNAMHCGIKRKRPDVALIYSIVKAQAAGVFTANKVKAAPVIVDMQQLRGNTAQAIVVNSGNANCCTGKRGERDAWKVVEAAARCLDVSKADVLVASTGVIGKFLPKEAIIKALPELSAGLGFDKAQETAGAIMTTDKFSKQTAVEFEIKGKRVTVGAVAKGAGMICPDMATMLCFVTTDACISAKALKKALASAVDESFNCISVDGEMSTNDSVIILANGLAANELIKQGTPEWNNFTAALQYVCLKLAKMIVEDGEGATKIIQVMVEGAGTKKEACQAAARIANSLLVKTMIAGENPNWGRISACVGASGARFAENKLEIFLQKKVVYKNAMPALKTSETLIRLLKEKNINITVKLHNGTYSHTIWASDLTAEYVKINTEYN
ncbi:MAG: bifunctional glutamate N-acetyltransferase/amino-acid acetyltransferase ArgJ [Candidatus Omnitrophica bacterium]|nr:bifunctional glutamate N-acetyltransferase/amino-acid acetyltransferase ArgJ [Candidatus Omnitrophota bacterium]MBU4478561.1 bifunctional glutamate N-acetyltransferase/amino-acid acetyltransferase ArgJ [Candidatus Omnitrophota bacterium]MCG2703560.1 bifunctional glutamate N-acetyltransferase/amino-acid acetyltransferase ArgJ [Candidatus Omnitrophota bacterium]